MVDRLQVYNPISPIHYDAATIVFLVQAASVASTGLAIAEAVDSDDGPGAQEAPGIDDAAAKAASRRELARAQARRGRASLITSGGKPGAAGQLGDQSLAKRSLLGGG